MQFDRQNRIDKSTLLRQGLPIIILVIIAIISYTIFYAPILYSDDWSLIIGRWYNGNLTWFDSAEQRPFLKAPLVVLYGIFGLNVQAFYAILWTLNVIAAIQLYFLILRLTSMNVSIAFAIAAMILVYPADFTHMWLTMIMIRSVVVVILMYAYLLLVYSDTGSGWVLVGALLCLVLPFGIYEGQLGVTITWAIFLALKKRASGWRKWPILLLPGIIGGLFLLSRAFGYSVVGGEDSNHYFEHVQVTPGVIVIRLIMGYRIMVWAWVEPIMHSLGLNRWQAVLGFLLVITFSGFLAYVIHQAFHKLNSRPLIPQQHLDQLRFFMWMMVIGSVFIAAGYIPFIAIFMPTLFPLGSRVNLFALMGGAVTIVSLLTVMSLVFGRKQSQINFITLAAAAPLIILGTLVQVQVQRDDRTTWEEQKQIWHELFILAPDLKDGTSVRFVISDNKPQASSLNRNELRLPLFGNWDVGTGLNMLYGKHSLHGDVAIKELFLVEGIKEYYHDTVIPYDRALVVAYDRGSKQLRIIEDLAAENLVDFPVSNYAPYERIIETPTVKTDFRWLVGGTTGK